MQSLLCPIKMRPLNPMVFLPSFFVLFILIIRGNWVLGVQILAKSKLEKCEINNSDSNNLNCTQKVIIDMAVPSGASGREASLVAQVVEVEDNSINKMQTFRQPPTITISKSAVYALYDLTYIRDVPYKPQEYSVRTRKCERDADASVVKICERLRDDQGHVIADTEPVCCPCGDHRRLPSSCRNFFDRLVKGKPNTAHCLRFLGNWFHVFAIGKHSVGFSVRIEVKIGSKKSEVIVGPHNRTATSNDNFLRVNLVGDYAGYSNIPSFENFFLVIPMQGGPGQPPDLGRNFSMWMLLERVRFTLDGLECDRIGVSYKAFNAQPNFCNAPYGSCLHKQLWNYHEDDQNRLKSNKIPFYGVERRFERINQHPNAGSNSFSIGITEILNTNVLIEMSADDIEYVNQRSTGRILSIAPPVFEALSQIGIANITTQNTGKVEASYSLTFSCSKGVSIMQEQYYIMKPQEVTNRSFNIHTASMLSALYRCTAILKDSEFNEVHRADCQFTTMATTIDQGTQIASIPPKSGPEGISDTIAYVWRKFWKALADFFSGKSCRSKCSGFFDFNCHIQYVCLSWIVLLGLLLAMFPTVIVLLWLLHQKGLFDPLHDWVVCHCFGDNNRFDRHRNNFDHHRKHMHEARHRHMHNVNADRRMNPHYHHGHHHHHHHHHQRTLEEGVRGYKRQQDHWDGVEKHKHHGHKKNPSLVLPEQGDEGVVKPRHDHRRLRNHHRHQHK